jgi:hypothetical protein
MNERLGARPRWLRAATRRQQGFHDSSSDEGLSKRIIELTDAVGLGEGSGATRVLISTISPFILALIRRHVSGAAFATIVVAGRRPRVGPFVSAPIAAIEISEESHLSLLR